MSRAGRGGCEVAGAGGCCSVPRRRCAPRRWCTLAVGTAIACVAVLVRDRRLAPAIARRRSRSSAARSPRLFGEHVLERAVLGVDLRAGRAAGTAVAAGTGAVERAKEALTTAVGINGFAPSTDWLLGGVIVVLVGAGAWCLGPASRPHTDRCGALRARRRPLRRSLLGGLGYVPGLLTASPARRRGPRAGVVAPTVVGSRVWSRRGRSRRVDRPVLREREAAVGWPVRAAVRRPARGRARSSCSATAAPRSSRRSRSRCRDGVRGRVAERAVAHGRRRHGDAGRPPRSGAHLDRGPPPPRGRSVLRARPALAHRDRPTRSSARAVRIVGDAGDTEVAVVALGRAAAARAPGRRSPRAEPSRLEIRPGERLRWSPTRPDGPIPPQP